MNEKKLKDLNDLIEITDKQIEEFRQLREKVADAILQLWKINALLQIYKKNLIEENERKN